MSPFLSQVGPCAFFTLKPSLKPAGAVLFSLGKSEFFSPSFYPHSRWVWGFQPPSWCHLSPKGQCDSGSLELHNQLYSQFVWGGFQGFGSLGSALIFAPLALLMNKVINPCSLFLQKPLSWLLQNTQFCFKGKVLGLFLIG